MYVKFFSCTIQKINEFYIWNMHPRIYSHIFVTAEGGGCMYTSYSILHICVLSADHICSGLVAFIYGALMPCACVMRMYVIYLLSRKSIEAEFGYKSEDPPPPTHLIPSPLPPLCWSPPRTLKMYAGVIEPEEGAPQRAWGGGGLLPHVCFHRPGVWNSECILYNHYITENLLPKKPLHK